MGIFRHHARDHRNFIFIQLVRDAVNEDSKHAGVGEQYLFLAVGRGVAFKVRGQILEQQLLNGRHARNERRADLIGKVVVFLAFRHRQRDLVEEFFVDVFHQKRAVLLRRQLEQVSVAIVDRKNELLTVSEDLDDRIAAGHAQRVTVHGDLRAFVVCRHAVSRRVNGVVFSCFVHKKSS